MVHLSVCVKMIFFERRYDVRNLKAGYLLVCSVFAAGGMQQHDLIVSIVDV